jgi:DNA modification methylase
VVDNVRLRSVARVVVVASGCGAELSSAWTLHLGDCIAGMATLADGSVDHVITDPPYSDHVHAKQWIGAALTEQGGKRMSTAHTGLGFDALTSEVATAALAQIVRVATRWTAAFCDLEGMHHWIDWGRSAGLDYVRSCIWDKVDSAPQFTGDRPASSAEAIVLLHPKGKKKWNGGGERNVFRFAVNGERGDKPHPSTKPVALMEKLISLFTDPGDLILDPFAGSGTTGVAAIRLGRRFIGWEKDPKYYAIAMKRLEAAREQMTIFPAKSPKMKQAKLL